jgi:hypothetical protein
MRAMAATAANKNRKIRQDALREQLSNQGHVQQVIEIAEKLNKQATSLESTHIQALRASADLHMRLVSKYLPDLKATEVTGPDGEGLQISMIERVIVKATDSDS